MKYRELIRIIQQEGWFLDRTVGSHLQFRHPKKQGTLTIPGGGKLSKDVPPGTLRSIFRQARFK